MLINKFFSLLPRVAIGFLLVLCGCGLLRPQPFSPLEMRFSEDLSLDRIRQVIDDRHLAIDTLWARFKIYIQGKNVKGQKFFNATVLYQAPDSFRLRGYRAITSTLFELVTKEDKMALFYNKQGELYVGDVEEWENDPELSGGLRITDIIYSLDVEKRIVQLLEGKNKRVYSTGNYYILIAPYQETAKNNAHLVTKMRKQDLLIKEIGLYDAYNRLRARVKYLGYGLYQGFVLPRELVIDFINEGITIRLRAVDYKPNIEFSPLAFEFPRHSGIKVLPLRKLKEFSTEPSKTGT